MWLRVINYNSSNHQFCLVVKPAVDVTELIDGLDVLIILKCTLNHGHEKRSKISTANRRITLREKLKNREPF